MQALNALFADTVEAIPPMWKEEDREQTKSTSREKYDLLQGFLTEGEALPEPRALPLPGLQLASLTATLTTELGAFLKKRKLGLVLGKSAAYRITSQPLCYSDISFIAKARLPEKLPLTDAFEGAPDLAIEVLSPTDLWWDVMGKMQGYFASGCRLMWLISPPDQTVLVYHADGQAQILHVGDALDGEEVVPDFTLPVAKLFAETDFE